MTSRLGEQRAEEARLTSLPPSLSGETVARVVVSTRRLINVNQSLEKWSGEALEVLPSQNGSEQLGRCGFSRRPDPLRPDGSKPGCRLRNLLLLVAIHA